MNNRPMDLFTPIVAEEKQHQNFKNMLSPHAKGTREILQGWAVGFPNRDAKFVREFQTTFNSCYWELYLHAALRDMGFEFCWDYPSPDFCVRKGGETVIIEATTANAAEGEPQEWERGSPLDPSHTRSM